MPIRRLPIPRNPPLRFGRNLTILLFTVLLPFVSIRATSAQLGSISQRIASQAIARWPGGRIESSKAARWNYSLGVLLDGMDATWYDTGNKHYFQYIQNSVDALITPDGTIPTYRESAYSLDNILLGRQALLLYRVTRKMRYYKAVEQLRAQLALQPTNTSGGFWHMKIYPDQMWIKIPSTC
jgi:unsaturated rhamnogalacturonyl hydrolase